MTLKKIGPIVLIASAIGVIGTLLFGVISKPEQKASSAKPPVPVLLSKVRTTASPVVLRATATVQADASVAIKPRIDGQIDEVHVVEGAEVKAGQLLFTLDDRSLRVAVLLAEAQLARDAAQLADAKRELERYQGLVVGQSVSRQKIDQTRTAFEVAQANVKADQAAIAAAEVQRSYTRITAPIDGRIGFIELKKGAVIRTSDASSLVVINRVHPVQISFSLPQKHLNAILENQTAAPLALVAQSPDGKSEVIGRLAFIDNAVDPTTGTLQLKGLFDNKDNCLWPGQLVDVALTLATEDNALVVPDQAVLQGQSGPYVWVVHDDQTVEVRPVKVARSEAGNTVLTQGVVADETVVLDGQFRLSANSRVISRTPDPQPSATDKPPRG